MKSTFFFLLASTASAASIRGLSECSSVPTDKYCHLLDGKSLMALNIANGAKTAGASAVQWEELADTHDNWRMEPANSGRYRLVAEHSGLYLATNGDWHGANVMQSQDPDEWCFVDQGNGYFMLKHASGYFLDTVDESHGANVVVASDNGLARSNQHWRLQCFKSTAPEYDTCESLPEGYCHIVAKHSQQAINVDGFSHESGSNIHMWWETEADNDDWRFEHTSNGYVHVISKHSGLGLRADGDNKGNSIVQSDMKDEWCFIREDDDYYQVKNRRNGLGLDVYKLGTETGTNLIQWPYGDGQANRLFKLKCDNSNNEDPVPEDDGCGRLDGCYLRNIKTGVETYLQHWENRYDVSRYGVNSDYTKYSIRCDVTGKMDQVDFFSGSVRHEEWNAPWWMNGDSGDYINDVDLLVDTSKCDQTFEVKVNGKTWGDGDCFIKTYTMKMECMD